MIMKQIKILVLLVAGMAVISSCRKSDNPKLPELTRFSNTPLVTKAAGSDQVISAQNPSSFTGKFTVDVYFKNEPLPQKYDVVVIKNGNTASVKTIKADVTSFPSSVTVTGDQLVALFGSPIVLNDRFDIGVDVTTQGGQKYLAFPATGAAYASGVSAQPGASPSINYQAVCKYDANVYQGGFKAKDEFGDADGATIQLTKIDATHFSFVYPSVLNPVPIVVTVDANTNSAAISGTQTIGSRWDPGYGYPNNSTYVDPSATSISGSVAPCDQKVTLQIVWGVQKGALVFNSSGYSLVLTKL
jgi:hypothetical protein